jgi:nicotinamidase-related amidase
MDVEEFVRRIKPFVGYLVDWQQQLRPLSLASLLEGGRSPAQVAIISVDVTNGFCRAGALASTRVAGIVPPIVALYRRAHALGVYHFIFPHDAHDPLALEFGSYPPHCVRGSIESEPVAELKSLPFFDDLVVMMPKNSIDAAVGTGLDPWLDDHPEVDTFIVVGDCTDICVYLLAIHLRVRANVANRQVRVIVPADSVDTYDLTVPIAHEIGSVPHDADLLHVMFLYHMMLNGVEIAARIE